MKKYKSPPHKLIAFFEKSRNQWKAKYLALQDSVKYFKNRIAFLTRSKEHWKNKSNTLEQELKKSEEEKILLKQEIESLKKKVCPAI